MAKFMLETALEAMTAIAVAGPRNQSLKKLPIRTNGNSALLKLLIFLLTHELLVQIGLAGDATNTRTSDSVSV
jgi:hypothetical protein